LEGKRKSSLRELKDPNPRVASHAQAGHKEEHTSATDPIYTIEAMYPKSFACCTLDNYSNFSSNSSIKDAWATVVEIRP